MFTNNTYAQVERAKDHMHILLASHFAPPHVGGIEVVAMEQAKRLASATQTVSYISGAAPAKPGTTYPKPGLRHTRLPVWTPLESKGIPFPFLEPISTLGTLLSLRTVDIVHIHDLLYPTSWVAAGFAAFYRKPLVVTQHVAVVAHPSPLVNTVQRLVYGTVGRAIVRYASAICYLNSDVRTMLRALGADEDRLHFVPNGVDTNHYHPATLETERSAIRRRYGLDPEATIALFVGRFVPKKGFDLLLKCDFGKVQLALVGGNVPVRSGDSPDPATSNAEDTQESQVWLGSRDSGEVAEIMRACDLFVLPSQAEGFPLTVQEAMASGLPVVTSDDPGYAPYGLDRSLVSLVPPTVEAVSAAVAALEKNPSLRAAAGRYSRSFAETSSWQAHINTMETIYGSALAAKTTGNGSNEAFTAPQ